MPLLRCELACGSGGRGESHEFVFGENAWMLRVGVERRNQRCSFTHDTNPRRVAGTAVIVILSSSPCCRSRVKSCTADSSTVCRDMQDSFPQSRKKSPTFQQKSLCQFPATKRGIRLNELPATMHQLFNLAARTGSPRCEWLPPCQPHRPVFGDSTLDQRLFHALGLYERLAGRV